MDIFQMVRRTKGIDEVFTALNKVEINTMSQDGENLLQAAIAYKRSDIALELIKRQIDVNHQDKHGMTPLHYTAWYHNTIIAKTILQNGGNPNIRDAHGNNALWYATTFSKGKYYDLVELLVDSGADPITNNKHEKSPLDIATQTNDRRLINLFIQSRDETISQP